MHAGKEKVCKSIHIESWNRVKEMINGKIYYKDKHEGKEMTKTV